MFTWLKRFCYFIVFVFTCLLAVVFSVENSQIVSPVFLGFPSVPLSLGLWMSMALFLGAFVGLLVSLLPVYIGKYSLFNKNKKIQMLEKEISALRLSTVKG